MTTPAPNPPPSPTASATSAVPAEDIAAALDQEIEDTRAEIAKGGDWQQQQLSERLESLYKARFGGTDDKTPGAETSDAEASESAEAPPVPVDWGAGEASPEDTDVRGKIQSMFGR